MTARKIQSSTFFMVKTIFFVSVPFIIAGCANNSLFTDEIVLKYSCKIPNNLPREEVFHDRTLGPEEIRKCYEISYEAGWERCLNTFLSGTLHRDTTISEAFPNHDNITASRIFFYAIEQGFEDCKKNLSKLVAKHGYEPVKQALDFKLHKVEIQIFSEKYIIFNPVCISATGLNTDCPWQHDLDKGIDLLNAYINRGTTPISIRLKQDLDSRKVEQFIEDVSSRYSNVSVEKF